MTGRHTHIPICSAARRCMRFLLSLGILFTATHASAAQPQVVDRIVAVVNDDIIVYQDINEMLRPLYEEMRQSGQPAEKIRQVLFDRRQKLLDMLIDQKLMLQETSRYDMSVSEKEVDETIERMKKANKLTDETLREALLAQGVTQAEFRNNYREQILLNRIQHIEVMSRIIITDQDITTYYEAHADQYRGKREYHLRHLMMDAPSFAPPPERQLAFQRMEGALAALKAGEPFIEVVKRHADRKYSESAGELGLFSLDDLTPRLKTAVEKLAVGQYTPIMETGQGYQIIFLEEIVQTPATAMAAVADEIRKTLLEETSKQRKKTWIEGLRKRAHIKIIN